MRLVFISHNSADADVAGRLLAQWQEQRPEDHLDLSCDVAAGPDGGTQWRWWIRRVVKNCDLVVFIASEHSNSPWCSAELGMAQLLGKPILPLRTAADALVNPVVDQHHMGSVQQPITEILGLADNLLGTPQDVARPAAGFVPYPGLTPLGAEHEAVVGRAQLLDRLLADVERVRREGGGRFVVVSGPSGSGKSSLVRAGVLPALRRRGWTVPAVTQPRQLAEAELPGPVGAGAAGLLVVDQGEELLTLDDVHRTRIGSWMRERTEDGTTVLLVVRSEFRSHLGAFVREPLDHYIPYVEPADLVDIIGLPAKYAQLDLDQALITRLVTETGSGEALPLLAYTLHQLWLDRDTSTGALRESSLDRLGGVRGVLGAQANEALRELSRGLDDRGRREVQEQALRTLAQIADATQNPPVRGPQPIESFTEEQRGWLDAFRARGLIAYRTTYSLEDVLEVDAVPGGTDLVDVTHEALFGWRPLAEVIARDRQRTIDLRAIGDAAERWVQTGRSDRSLLLSGPRLALALDEKLSTRPGVVGEFVRQSLRGDRERRVRRALTVGVAALAVVAVVAGVLAWDQRGDAVVARLEAEDARLEAQAVRVAAQANEAISTRRDLALLAAASAYRLKPTIDTEGALVNALATPTGPVRYFRDQSALWGTLRSVGPGTGVVVTADRGLATVDLATRSLAEVAVGAVRVDRLFTEPGSPAVAFSGVSGSGADLVHHAGAVVLPSGSPQVVTHGTQVTAVVDHPAGLVFGDADGGVFLAPRDGDRLGDPVALDRHRDPVRSLTSSADGQWVASAGPDGVIVHHIVRGAVVGEQRLIDVAAGSRTAETVVFRRDGPLQLLGSGSDPVIRRWVLREGEFTQGAPVGRHPGVVRAMTVDPDSGVLFTAGAEGGIQRWDLDAGAAQGDLLEAHESDALGLSTAGLPMLVSTDKQGAILWDLAPSRVVARSGVIPAGWEGEGFVALVDGEGPLAAVTADGRVLVEGAADLRAPPGVRRAWWTSGGIVVETSTQSQVDLGPLDLWAVGAAEPEVLASGVDAADVGRCLAALATGDVVRFLDVGRCGATPPELRGAAAPIVEVALSPDESRVAVAEDRGALQVGTVGSAGWDPPRKLSTAVVVTALAWLPGDKLAVGFDLGADPQVLDVAGDSPAGAGIVGHDDAVWWLALQASRGRLFSAGQDALLVQTDLAQMRQVGRPLVGARRAQQNDEDAAVTGLHPAAAGDALIVLHGHRMVAWDLSPESLLVQACANADRRLTEAEVATLGLRGVPPACPEPSPRVGTG